MQKNTDINAKLEEFREKEAEDLAQMLAEKYGLPYADLSRMTIDLDALKIVAEKDARAGKLAVFQKVAKRLQVAVLNPELPKTKEPLKNLSDEGFETELFLVSEAGLERAWARYKEIPAFEEMSAGLIDISPEKLEDFEKKTATIAGFTALLDEYVKTGKARKVSEIVEVVLAGALSLDASDVHFEPREAKTQMRLRLDGVLHEAGALTKAVYGLVLSRIKLLAEMKLNVHDRAQDGRFTVRTKNMDMEVRVSALPAPFGETLVLRVLNPKNISITMNDLGMHPEFLKTVESELKRPNGMILTTGPTGSGKTTTLYTFIKAVNKTDIKIVTIEDPIEYRLSGISQTQVEPGKDYTFANGLRSILRQDPDIILVGEIRDLETAEIAMHAALTGHLVFSTLHTNNAAGTIPRLIDLKADPTIIAPAINMAMAQRLVRKLCPKCKKEAKPDEKEKDAILKAMKEMPDKYKPDTAKKDLLIWKPVGCKECNGIGYKGRIGIFEAFLVDDSVEKAILARPPESELKEAMKRQGMITMFQDGVIKILLGQTSLEELLRVASE